MKTVVTPPVDLLLPVSLQDGQWWIFSGPTTAPFYVVGPSTEAITSVKHQVLSPAQKPFSLSYD